jgi:hypothetical protein
MCDKKDKKMNIFAVVKENEEASKYSMPQHRRESNPGKFHQSIPVQPLFLNKELHSFLSLLHVPDLIPNCRK